ncbi:cyclin-D3-1-like [Phragmites australis]|uniref:cyclin-D3-1-like n=1 Tax=Phragmites australis TaxID=29695 RepID=UPI002D7A1871|nr:cyclin-D3-1-like [Phragmites australis]
MTPSFDCAASILLCEEDSTVILDLEEEENEEISWVLGPSSHHADASSGVLLIDFPLPSEGCIEALLGKEEEHLPTEGYAQLLLQQPAGLDLVAIRSNAIDWIWKVREHYKFGPLTAVLSVNYLDRFLSLHNVLHKAWMTQLLAVACLSLAAKMEETIVPYPLDLQASEAKYVFEARTIQRMELLVLNTLSWRMHAVTACSFMDYYLHKFSDGDTVSKIVLARSVDLILSISKVAEFLVFRPSEIAASVALVALGKHESSVLGSVASCCKHLRKERVLGCYEVIQDKIVMGNIILKSVGSSVFITPHSPIGVLDATVYESQLSESTTAGAPTVYSECSPACKRRKFCI